MTMAKAITAKESPAQRLFALTVSFAMTILIIDLVSTAYRGRTYAPECGSGKRRFNRPRFPRI